MQKVCNEVLTELGLENDRLFKLAMELERIALEDPYFVEEALPERRLLLGHRAEGARHPDLDVLPASSRSPAPWAGSRSGKR